MSAAVLGERECAIVADAAAWRLLGKLFERPRPGWAEEVAALTPEVHDEAVRAAAQTALEEATEARYLALLGPGGAASPRGVAYQGPMVQPGALLARLNGLYQAFAFQPEAEEPPDHLAVELGCMAFLHLKEAWALAHGEDEAAGLAAAAAGLLREDHLRATAEPVAEVLTAAGGGYLALAAQALLARTGPRPPGPEWVVPEEEECAELACGCVGE